MRTNAKTLRRKNIRYRIRAKISGTSTKPRLAVFRSNKDIYVQLIDDVNGVTLASASSRSKEIAAQSGTKSEISKIVGQTIGRKAKELGIETAIFDRGGYLYHGRVNQVAEGAREAGMVL